MLQREEASCNEVRKFEHVPRPLYMTCIINTQHPQTSFAGESCSYLHFKSIVQNTFHIFGFVHKLLKSEEIIFKKKNLDKIFWSLRQHYFCNFWHYWSVSTPNNDTRLRWFNVLHNWCMKSAKHVVLHFQSIICPCHCHMGGNPSKRWSEGRIAQLNAVHPMKGATHVQGKENQPITHIIPSLPATLTQAPRHINNAILTCTSKDQALASQLWAEWFKCQLHNKRRKSAWAKKKWMDFRLNFRSAVPVFLLLREMPGYQTWNCSRNQHAPRMHSQYPKPWLTRQSVMSHVIPCHNPYLLPITKRCLCITNKPLWLCDISAHPCDNCKCLQTSRATSLSCSTLFTHDHLRLLCSWYSFPLHSLISQSMSAIYATQLAHTCC